MKHKHIQKDFFKRLPIKETEARRIALKTLQMSGALRNFSSTEKLGHSSQRSRNRRVSTGRARSATNNLYFKIPRPMIRELASKGLLPGPKKAS